MHMAAARLGCQKTMVGNKWSRCMSKLRKCYSHRGFISGREGCLGSKRVLLIESADYCMLINEWAWLMSRVCLLRMEVEFASVLESKIGQKWRYSALKACIG